MRVSVIGAGALGKAYGGLLSLSGHDVHYLMRSEFAEIKQTGFFALKFTETGKTLKIKNPQIYSKAEDLPVSDLIIVTIKTTSNDQIESLLASCRTDHSIVLVIQNGIGNEEFISQYTGKSPILCGISMMGAFRKAVDVEVVYLGYLVLASYKPEYDPQREIVRKALSAMSIAMPVKVHESYRKLRWFKLTWNLPFGGLALMFKKTTGILASEEPYSYMLYDIISEIREIALAEGFYIDEESVQALLESSRSKTEYLPSICHDFNSGRKIEREYIFDNALAIGKKLKVKTPLLHLLDGYLDSITK